jgi:hypothetical protein
LEVFLQELSRSTGCETPSILAGTGIITGLGQNGFAGTGTGAVKASAVKQNIAQRASE